MNLRAIEGPDKLPLPVLFTAGDYKTEYPEPGRRMNTPRLRSGFSILRHLRWAKSEQNPAYELPNKTPSEGGVLFSIKYFVYDPIRFPVLFPWNMDKMNFPEVEP